MQISREPKSAAVQGSMQASHDQLDDRMAEQYLRLLKTDGQATALAVVSFAFIGAVLGVWGVVALAMFGAIGGILRHQGGWAVRNGRMPLAVGLMAAGMWMTALGTVWVLPISIAAMVFNLVVPVIVGSTYLSEDHHRLLVAASVLVATALGFLAYSQSGFGLEEGVADWVVDGVAIGYLVGHIWVFSATVRNANRVRVETLDAALISNAELRLTESELRHSRRRLVQVADEERGRIERNIHDGAQQRLVSLAVQLRLASQMTDKGSPPDAATLDGLHDEATEALHELRELAGGIYPSILVDRGLLDAVHAAARKSPLPVTVDGPADIDLEPQAQLALYFIVLEALQNATKHAGPDVAVHVALHADDAIDGGPEAADRGVASVRISDDGAGFDPGMGATSRGLLNMADRMAAIGGELSIDSAVGSGTTITARLPLGTT